MQPEVDPDPSEIGWVTSDNVLLMIHIRTFLNYGRCGGPSGLILKMSFMIMSSVLISNHGCICPFISVLIVDL
jgi:hypothetical protein